MTLDRDKLFQFFKYAVYTLLTINIYIFWREEYLASQLQFAAGVPVADLIEAFAATIDTAAWVVLLLMFELETYVLEDRHFTPRVTLLLHSIRVICFVFILYAFYGYVVNVIGAQDVRLLANVSDLCSALSDNWSYAVDLDEYVAVDAANCASFSGSDVFYQFADLPALVDHAGLVEIQRLAWVDAINALVWILIVVILEADVRLQERNKLEGAVLKLSGTTKIVLYAILFVAAIYWGFKGDFVDFWDAFLWLLAFFFIEMNVVEWRAEEAEGQPASA